MHQAILVSKSITKKYNEKLILENIDLDIHNQEIVTLIGPSGVGKTTLLNILTACEIPTSGEVLNEAETGYVFQEDRLLPWLTVFENVKLVATSKIKDSIIWKNLELVNLKKYYNYFPDELSGGMKQRVSIARALTYGGSILFLDEPFKSLDEKLRYEMLDLIAELRDKEKVSSLFVTHDVDEALYISDRILLLNKKSGSAAKIVEEYNLKEERNNGKLPLEIKTKFKRRIAGISELFSENYLLW